MRHVLVVGGLNKTLALAWDALHDLLVARGYPGMVAIIYGLWNPEATLKFPHVVFNHLSHLGPSHDVDATGGKDIEDMLTLLDVTAPVDAAILWNGSQRVYYHWRRAFEKRGIPIFFAEKAGIGGGICLDPTGIDGMSEISHQPLTHVEIDEALVEVYAKLFVANSSHVPVPEQDPTLEFIRQCRAEGRKLIFYLGLWDGASGIKDYDPLYALATSPWYSSSQEALDSLISTLEKSEEKVAVLIKAHPSDEQPLFTETQAFPVLHVAPKKDPVSVMRQCDVVATIASTLSYVAIALEKPVKTSIAPSSKLPPRKASIPPLMTPAQMPAIPPNAAKVLPITVLGPRVFVMM